MLDYLSIIKEAIDLGYESVMIDASRLPFGRKYPYHKRDMHFSPSSRDSL